MGKTTYGNFFQQPNPEDYAKRNKNREKLEDNPNYGHQYGTNLSNIRNNIQEQLFGSSPSSVPS